ncbi:MAG: ABC transporter ATP-binding protein [Solirubrobacteraceae bacterium]|nr:MAG: ABC transporter ATP-binding protein [Solirubrobacterales bacterium]
MLRAEASHRWAGFELDIALEVPEGRCLALAGPSGAGKTSVLRIIAGLLAPSSGRVSCGQAVWLDTARGVSCPPEQRRCGYVFQDYALFEHLAVWRNVAFPVRKRRRSERRAGALELLDRFGIGGLADARPSALSGGERQRVALARTLALRPRALLLDEPLSALDRRTRSSAARELGALLRDAGVPTVLVTHDFAEAALLGDRVGVIDGGRVVQRGTASELAGAPASAFVADFAGAVVLTGIAHAAADGTTRIEIDGGGSITAIDSGRGPVAATVFPWEIAIQPLDAPSRSSAQNRIEAEVVSITALGQRVRVALAAPQALVAEVTERGARELGLHPGMRVAATWKATATRVVRR